MAYLFTVENGIVKPNTETLLVSPFKEIWERDTSKFKTQAIKEFTFIEFMTSKKKTNPYAGYSDANRLQHLKKLYFTDEWTPDTLVEQGMAKIVEFMTEGSPTYSYYIDVLTAAEKIKTYLRDVDLNERNERNGMYLHKVSDITRSMKDTDQVLQNLNSIKEKVEQELFDQTKTRSNKQINPFET